MLLQITEPNDNLSNHKEAIGIDLGTTNSVVAISKNGKPYILEDEEGPLFVPSAVAYLNEGVLVGAKTLEYNDVITSSKRSMHTPLQPLFKDKGAVHVVYDILSYLKKRAEKALKKEVEEVVITVPAYFDDTARQATKDAARLAGLTVLRLINEPTAAALAYGLDKHKIGTYAVYDFGGGTFDISILKLHESVFQVLATGGAGQLGGDDIDHKIANHWIENNPLAKTIPNPQLKNLACTAKESLNFNPTFKHYSKELDLTLKLDRSILNDLVQPLIQQTFNICKKVLKDAGINQNDIFGVILVGGSSRLYGLSQALADFWKLPILTDLEPDLVVAYGAALQAENLSKGANNLLLDVTPLSLGIEVMGGLMEKIIFRNTAIPASVSQEFTTSVDGQTTLKLHILQGESELVKDCRSLSKFILQDIPPMKAGVPRITVTFTIDADGILSVTAREKTTNITQTIEVKPSYGLSEKDLQKMLIDYYQNAGIDIEERLTIAAKLKAQELIDHLQLALNKDRNLLSDAECLALANGMNQLKISIEQDNRKLIENYIKDLTGIATPFIEKRLRTFLQS